VIQGRPGARVPPNILASSCTLSSPSSRRSAVVVSPSPADFSTRRCVLALDATWGRWLITRT
jgi:hypothetical protein